jgi:hypothetical protein
MVSVDLDDAEKAALIAVLKQAIAADPFPISARAKILRGILAKLLSQERLVTVKQNIEPT